MLEETMDKINFPGMYRGVCVDNYDPDIRGRVKIYIPGVYPKEFASDPDRLPWAEPVMPIFGGSWKNERGGDLNPEVGVSTIPHTSSEKAHGAQLWVFFERDDQNYPKYFGATQAGPGWLSEHNNQHVIKTDNVRVRIDENPGAGTCKFDSYNKNNNHLSQKKQISQMPTRTDIEIWNKGANAVNIIIKGNVNMKVDGDIFEEHTGDKHITHIGNVYKKHKGDTYEEHNGHTTLNIYGDEQKLRHGDTNEIQTGNFRYTNTKGDILYDIKEGEYQYSQIGNYLFDCDGAQTLNIKGDVKRNVTGNNIEGITGQSSVQAQELKFIATEDIVSLSNEGNIIIQTFGRGIYDTKQPLSYPNLWRGGIIMHGDYVRTTATGTCSTPDLPPVPVPYRYIPAIIGQAKGNWGIEDNTGNQIHHNSGVGQSNTWEYDILQA